MANMRLSTSLRNAMIQAVQTKIDAGPAAGTINIRSGVQPATAEDAETGTLLATLTCSDPSAGAAAAGVLTLSAITEDASADATGTATWARIKDSTGATVFDCDVGTSGATINLNTAAIVAGGPVRITSFTCTMPAG